MSRDGYLPKSFGKVDKKYGTPKNAILFCIVVSLSGPILGREALGWFVDMSAIGASIGYFFTCASALVTARRSGDGSVFLKIMAVTGTLEWEDPDMSVGDNEGTIQARWRFRPNDTAACPHTGAFRCAFWKGKLSHAHRLAGDRACFLHKREKELWKGIQVRRC